MVQQPQSNRRYRRHKKLHSARIGAPGQPTASAVTLEVSEGGLALLSEGQCRPGERIHIDVQLTSDGPPLAMDGYITSATRADDGSGPPRFRYGIWLLSPPRDWRDYCRELDYLARESQPAQVGVGGTRRY